jgi:ABC-type maltose transport system permease subunit
MEVQNNQIKNKVYQLSRFFIVFQTMFYIVVTLSSSVGIAFATTILKVFCINFPNFEFSRLLFKRKSLGPRYCYFTLKVFQPNVELLQNASLCK